jgi:hypothetical protein
MNMCNVCACRSPEPEPGEGGGNGLTLSITANMDALRYKLYPGRNECKKKLDYTGNICILYIQDIFSVHAELWVRYVNSIKCSLKLRFL